MRRSSRSSVELRKGLWTAEEDNRLRHCIALFGGRQMASSSLQSWCRKSCRLRWLNYLKPDIKRGDFSSDEVDLMIRLHKLLGNRWSLIAGRLPGRTANSVKNYWNTHLLKKTVAISAIAAEKGTVANSDSYRGKTIRPVPSSVAITVKPRPRSFLRKNCNNNKDDLVIVDGIGRKFLPGGTPSRQGSPPSSTTFSVQNDKDSINCEYEGVKSWGDSLILNDENDRCDNNTCPSSFDGGSPSLDILNNDFSTSLTSTPDPEKLSNFAEGEVVGGAVAVLGDVTTAHEEALFGYSDFFSPDSDFWDQLLLDADQYHHQEQPAATMVL